MVTNKWVESGFWNFDALFQPQQHPARDAHDTFFIKEPSFADAKKVPQDYMKRVKEMHEKGLDKIFECMLVFLEMIMDLFYCFVYVKEK